MASSTYSLKHKVFTTNIELSSQISTGFRLLYSRAIQDRSRPLIFSFNCILYEFVKMSDKFWFSAKFCDTNKMTAFKSNNGDDYYVNYMTTKFGEIVLKVEWILSRRNLVKVELFTADFELISSQLRVGDENQVCLKFCVNTQQDDSDNRILMFVITVIPCMELKDCTTSNKEEELNLDDNKIKDLSEDLLIGLAMDMRDLYIHGDLSDAIMTNGSHVVKVHSVILSARSPVFREMFRHPSHEKIITITDASARALEDMAEFIYSGFIKVDSMDRAEELYMLANEYEIEDLHEVCSVYMSNCTIDRVLDTLVLADKHQDYLLKRSSIDLIVKNLADLKSTEKWASFSKENIDLVSEIFSSLSGVLDKNTLHSFMSRMSNKSTKL